MANQPSYRPLEPSEFFEDGRSARPAVPGTVARGHLHADRHRYTGKVGPGDDRADYADAFPEPVTQTMLERGQERYTIFCAVCHDAAGTGNGKVVERGYLHPPAYSTDLSRGFERRGVKLLLREAPVGYFFHVISEGFGAMPSYAAQIDVSDRWAIVAYLRALQLSQHATLTELPPAIKEEALKALEGKP